MTIQENWDDARLLGEITEGQRQDIEKHHKNFKAAVTRCHVVGTRDGFLGCGFLREPKPHAPGKPAVNDVIVDFVNTGGDGKTKQFKIFMTEPEAADLEGKAEILSTVVDRATLRNGDLFISWKKPFDILFILGEGVPRRREWRA